MGLPWVRLDTSFPTNPKILELVDTKRHKAAFVYICGLTYAGLHGTDGFIPASVLPFIHATKTEAGHLVDAGLWLPMPGGWAVNGWDEFQVSDDAAKKRRERAQKAAAKRWERSEQPAPKGHLRGI